MIAVGAWPGSVASSSNSMTLPMSFVPDMEVALDREAAGKMFRLVDALEDLDDVQNIFANYDVSDEIMEQLQDA